MLEIGKEGLYTTINFSKSLFKKDSTNNYRETIHGNVGNVLIIRGYGKKPSLPEERIKNEMKKYDVGGILTGISPYNQSLDVYTSELKDELKNLDKKTVLLGISLGGLIALKYIYQNGWPDNIVRLITVATPFNGVRATKKLNNVSPIFEDLKPENKFFEEIRSASIPENKCTHFFAKWDEFVGDPNKIDVQGKKVIFPIGGHNSFLCDKRVASSVIETVIFSFSSQSL